jgi:predicted nucleic acid-binding protein
MARRVIDTSVLCSFWHRRSAGRRLNDVSTHDVKRWAQELIEVRGNAIVTPVGIEFLAGARKRRELELFRAFLGCFEIIDNGEISSDDWRAARRLAERIPRDGKPRHLGDCLIRAIARRLKCEVDTSDQAFPR